MGAYVVENPPPPFCIQGECASPPTCRVYEGLGGYRFYGFYCREHADQEVERIDEAARADPYWKLLENDNAI